MNNTVYAGDSVSEQYKLRLVLSHITWLVDGCMMMNQQLDHLNIAIKTGDI